MKRYYSQKGFTLIELLIVIVIIAILAAVVIGVLNPVEQQNRARDGAVRSNISKMVMAGKSLQVSTARANKAPTQSEFIASIGNVGTDTAHTCINTLFDYTGDPCAFDITGVPLPSTCQSAYGGSGTSQCRFGYHRSGNTFRIAAKTFSNAPGMATPGLIVYEYVESQNPSAISEGFYACGAGVDITGASLPAPGASGCTRID